MKIKEDLMLRNIAGEWIVVPMGERLTEFCGMMRLNDSGAFIWEQLQKETTKEEIISAMRSTYDAAEDQLVCEVDAFIKKLNEINVLEA